MENTRHEDQAGSSSNLFPVAINFASIIFHVTFGISPEVSTEEINGGKMKHLCLSGKGSWVWLDHQNELSVPCTRDRSRGAEGLSQQHDGEHTAQVQGSISWTLDTGDHQH